MFVGITVLAVVIGVWIIRFLLFITMHPIRALVRVVHSFAVVLAVSVWITYFTNDQNGAQYFWPAVGVSVASFIVGAVRRRIDR